MNSPGVNAVVKWGTSQDVDMHFTPGSCSTQRKLFKIFQGDHRTSPWDRLVVWLHFIQVYCCDTHKTAVQSSWTLVLLSSHLSLSKWSLGTLITWMYLYCCRLRCWSVWLSLAVYCWITFGMYRRLGFCRQLYVGRNCQLLQWYRHAWPLRLPLLCMRVSKVTDNSATAHPCGVPCLFWCRSGKNWGKLQGTKGRCRVGYFCPGWWRLGWVAETADLIPACVIVHVAVMLKNADNADIALTLTSSCVVAELFKLQYVGPYCC